jgi:anti-anti-sigma regulatory factor
VLRITIIDEPSEQRWVLQGRISGPWVAQLQSNWKNSAAANGQLKRVVDLNGVTLVDLNGEKVLCSMMKDGAEFVATGVYMKHLVETLEQKRRHCLGSILGFF